MASANFPPSFTHGEDEEADVRRGHEVGRKGERVQLLVLNTTNLTTNEF